MTDVEEVFKRQLGIIHPELISNTDILFVGCGSVGSVAAIFIAKMGARFFRLVDGDKFEDHNVPNQFVPRANVGQHKTTSLKEDMKRYAPQPIVVETVPEMFSPLNSGKILSGEDFEAEIVIVSVDSLKARKMIYRELKQSKTKWLIDGRTAQTIARVYTINLANEEDCQIYEKSLEGTPSEVPCSERSVMFNVGVVGGIIGAQLRNILLHPDYYHREILIDLDHILVMTPR